MTRNLKALAEWIENHDEIAVFTHLRPDGDAYGTAFALTLAIRSLGKKVFCACQDGVEEMYQFLPESDQLRTPGSFPFEPKAILCADVADVKRLGKLEESFLACKETAVLDHHGTNPGFGNVNVVNASAAAAAEIALDLILLLNVQLTKEIAVNLYTAISTDCGNFSFGNTKPETYRKAAICLESGIRVEEITRRLYRTRSLQKTRLLGLALSRIEMFAKGRVAAIRLTKEMYASAEAVQADSQNIVNYLNEIENVQIGILADDIPGGVKFSFRAAGGADVASLAQKFGGGGHKAAAGASVFGEEAETVYRRVIEEAVKQVMETA